MGRYVIRRVAHSVFTLFILVVALFFAMHTLGDPVALMLDTDYSQSQYDALQHELGYDRPVVVQFQDYMTGILQGDFGESLRRGQPALDIVLASLPKTLFLGALAFLISLLGIPLGILAATRPRSWIDQLVNASSFAMLSAPNFWVALLGIYIFAVQLNWLPTSGFGGYLNPSYLVLPAVVLALNSLARFAQLTRTAVMEELTKQYVQTAHAKGLGERVILWLHVLKNAAISILTLAGDEAASIVNGSVIMETIFGWPGMGFLMISAIEQRDLPLVLATVVVAAVLVMLINLVVDLVYGWVDPRIQYQ
ncbi:ABC transporter permease [Tenggerimyces flavus]|uniref:ABC transporter permease n=1 Tax=Tenggerimyces flavus TaxID=1708749 RepID=A0ABV7YE27_9ACTN|nr:ABC transporter permease [Tenggerimyces flavus]MBM7789784.1 peptide/nickel transport system permease protein [Tenggerimyces flavus]